MHFTTGANALSDLEFALRVFVALAFGSIIGVERQWRQRMAGLRTNALVATSTCLFVALTPLLGSSANPTQIPAYIVSGIGFLAGGVIFKERSSVSGLNTAATLWSTAAIGVLVGFGYILDAAIGLVAILTANVVLRPIAQRLNARASEDSERLAGYEIHAVCREEAEERVRAAMIAAIEKAGITLTAVYSDDLEGAQGIEVTADVTAAGRSLAKLEKIVSRLAVDASIVSISWKAVPMSEDEREVAAAAVEV